MGNKFDVQRGLEKCGTNAGIEIEKEIANKLASPKCTNEQYVIT